MRKVLIADDSKLNRTLLCNILQKEYEVLEAADGREAIALLKSDGGSLSAVLLDIVMPVADGFEVLKFMSDSSAAAPIPALMCAGFEDEQTREKAYALGAAGFLTKPYNPEIVLNALHNIIRICETAANKSTVMNDKLTGLMTGEAFFEKVTQLTSAAPPGTYVMECTDIDNFKVINSLYGIEEGNNILRQIADRISRMCSHIGGICGHIYADNFAMVYPNNSDADEYVSMCRDALSASSDLQGYISISSGRYVIADINMSANAMYDYASIAKHSVKGMYDKHFAYFDDSMLAAMLQNQIITGEMNRALEEKQFEVWLQPQINSVTGEYIGAEALARWRHPERGLISPGVFIPVFEQNGFIYELDKYVWEQACALLRRWTDEGRHPLPISVNISRYEMLKEDFFDAIYGLVRRYDIHTGMLRLEITESALANSEELIVETVKKLKEYGFTVEIDDFGSGYSSLNTIKDVPADVIKLDMRFLEQTDSAHRSGNIIESVVRMVKWLGMSVLAEGVETKQQADFLKTVGCNYIQGFLYAKPMPVAEYESFMEKNRKGHMTLAMETVENLDSNAFWDPNSMETLIFNSYVGGAAIIEFHNGKTEVIRVNDRFRQEFGEAFLDGVHLSDIAPEGCMDGENLTIMYDNIRQAIRTNKESTCETAITGLDGGGEIYLRSTVRVIAWTSDRYLLYCVVNNVTAQRLAEKKEQGIYAELLDNLPCGAGLYEYDGRNLEAVHLNRQYWELVGRPAKHGGNIDALKAVHPDDIGTFLPEITDALLQKRDAVCNVRIMCGDGDYQSFHVVCRIRAKKDGKYTLYAFFMPTSDSALLLEEQNKSRRDKNRLDFIFKNAAISVWSYNLETGEIIQNERSRKMHGYDTVVTDVPESLIDGGFIHPDSVDEYLAMYQRLRDGEKEVEGVFRVRNADRTGYWFEHIRYAAISGSDEKSELVFGISSDVSAEYEQDNAIHQWMSLISDMQVEKNAICEFNLTKNVFVRKQGNLFPGFKFSKTDPFDAYILAWAKENVYPEDAEKLIEFLDRDKLLEMHGRGVLDGGIDYRAELQGVIRWCSLSIKFIQYPADDDVRLIMVHTDINARKEDELRLIEENRHDALTGVLNRKAFEFQVNKTIEADRTATHALFMIDIDDFKNINDVLGHIAGDNVLKRTADGLRSLLRGDDLVGRLGGDEFMVLLKNISNRDVISRRAQMILEMMHTVLDRDVLVSVSFGIAIAPKDGDSFDQLYRRADKAAYHSKQNGKNRYTFYDEQFGDDGVDLPADRADTINEEALKAWDERTQQILLENQRLTQRQEEDERYRMVIESTHITTFEWNAVSGKFAASPEFYDYTLSDQGGEQLFSENVDVSGVHPDDRALFYGKFLEKVLSCESAPETSLRLELKKGGYSWCRLGALVFFDKAERLQKAIGVITAENVQKKQSDVQLDAIFKFMSAGVMLLEVKKPDITALYVSESYYRLENTQQVSQLTGDALKDVHPEDYQKLKNNLFICSISGAVMEQTFRVVRGGKTFWRHMHAVRIPYPDAADPVMIAVETDITDVKLREELLERQQELFGSVFDTLNVVSWYYYPGENRAVLNQSCADTFALKREVENAPESFVADGIVHPEDGDAFLDLHKRLLTGGKSDSAVVRIRQADGSYEPRKLVYTGIIDQNGSPCCAIGISQSVESRDENGKRE